MIADIWACSCGFWEKSEVVRSAGLKIGVFWVKTAENGQKYPIKYPLKYPIKYRTKKNINTPPIAPPGSYPR